MKAFFAVLMMFVICCCTKTDEATSQPIELQFQHHWNTNEFNSSAFENTTFTLPTGYHLTLTRLRYLISEIEMVSTDGKTYMLSDYQLIDVNKSETTLLQTLKRLPIGEYPHLRFRFGFQAAKNSDGIYRDLNAASWNVPARLGGGYHFLQMDGKFGPVNETINQPFNYHMIAAADLSGEQLHVEDTSFLVDLGAVTLTASGQITITMDVSNWFTSPVVWDLTRWSVQLMPNFEAQKAMHQNGKNVFQLQR